MSWRYVVCDYSGNGIGEPEATNRQYNPGISTTETASCQVRVGSPLWSEIEAGDTTLKVYDSAKNLRFYGDIVTDELSGTGQGGTVVVTASDLSFRLSQRFVGKDETGVGLAYENEDARGIAFDLLVRANAEQDTGISIGDGFVDVGSGGGSSYGVPGTFGPTALGTTYFLADADKKWASPATLTEYGSILSLTADIGADPGGPVSQSLTAELYADTGGGQAGALVGTSSPVSILHNQARGPVVFPFSAFTAAPGQYWYTISAGGTTQGSRIYYTPGGTMVYNNDTYGDGPSNPFGTPSTAAQTIAAYISYVTVAPPAEPSPFVGPTVTYLWRKALDAISELGAMADSFEWALRYRDGTPPTVYLDLISTIGTDRSDLVFFEYGTGQNGSNTFKRTRSVLQRATRVYALGSGSTLVAQAFDTAAEAKGRAEDVLSVGDITDDVLLSALATQHVAIRKNPRTTVSMTLRPKTGQTYGIDWLKGDYVSARAVMENTVLVDGVARVWGAQISVDESGTESAQPILEPT